MPADPRQTEQIPFTREFVAGPDFWWRAALAMTVQWNLRWPTRWVLGAILVIMSLLLIPISEGKSVIVIAIVVGVTVVNVVLFFATFAAGFRKQFAPGTTMRSGFGTESFVVEQPKSTTRLTYDSYKAARRRGPLVMMKMGRWGLWVPYPGALFSDDDVARFNPPRSR